MTSPSSRATVSANVLTGFPAILRAHGADPGPLLKRARIVAAALADPEARLPVASVAKLLEEAAREAGIPDLGLQLAQGRRLSHFGAVGLLARDEPDLRQALHAITSWLHLHSEVILAVREEGGTATLSAHLAQAAAAASTQVNDLVVGGIHQVVRHLAGPDWHPHAVTLMHPGPTDPRPYRHHFGSPVQFDAEANALYFPAADLDQPLGQADPLFRSAFERQVEDWAGQQARPVEAQVRALIRVMLPTGRCSMDDVALRLGLQSRTLRRHLLAAGVTFASELEAARRELAQRYLAGSARPAGAIAALLGFSEPSAFSRWFARAFGCAPTEWRAKRAATPRR